MKTEIQIYYNSSKLMNSLFLEINGILNMQVNNYEIQRLKDFKKKFKITKKNIIESIKEIKSNEYNEPTKSNQSNISNHNGSNNYNNNGSDKSHFTDIDTLNISQLKINIIGLEGIIKSKENFYNNYSDIKNYNINLYKTSSLAYNESIKEIIYHKYPKTNSFSDIKILENKKILYNSLNKYKYTFFQEFHKMKIKNSIWIKEIDNEVKKEYEHSNYIIDELKNDFLILKNNIDKNPKGMNSNITNKLLFIEEEIPNYIYYAKKLKDSLLNSNSENTYNFNKNSNLFNK